MSDPNQQLQRPIDPDLISRFVENQAQELDIRRGELELRKQEIASAYTQAERILEAQSKDRELERQHNLRLAGRNILFSVFFLLLIAFGIGYALHLNKDHIVIELAKYIGLLIAGGLSGYSIRVVQDKNEK